MKIHEYQAKEIFKFFNVPIAKGALVEDPEDAIEAAKTVSDNLWVVKAQIHAGGRGKGGGVKIAKSLEEVKSLSSEIIGMNLVTHQTGKDGKRVRRFIPIISELRLFTSSRDFAIFTPPPFPLPPA
jgi:succinyl-CoA synthetase beta subunit